MTLVNLCRKCIKFNRINIIYFYLCKSIKFLVRIEIEHALTDKLLIELRINLFEKASYKQNYRITYH